MRDAAALLSLLAVSVADPNEFAGFVVVAVKLALDLSAETVRPISTRAERAIPARRAAGLRIRLFPFLSASLLFRFRAVLTRGTICSGPSGSIGLGGVICSFAGTTHLGAASTTPRSLGGDRYGYCTPSITGVGACVG